MPSGYSKQFAASGTYSDGTTHDITTQVTWSSSNTSVVTVNSSGLATSAAVGTASIFAVLENISGSTTLTVTPAILTSIAVTPANPTTPAGNTKQFAASGTYSDGTSHDITTQVTWSSSNAPVATVNSSGLASPLSVGSTTITATSGTISGCTALTVTTKADFILFSNSYIDVLCGRAAFPNQVSNGWPDPGPGDLPAIAGLGVTAVLNYDGWTGVGNNGSNHNSQMSMADIAAYLNAAQAAGVKVLIDLCYFTQFTATPNAPYYHLTDMSPSDPAYALGKSIYDIVNTFKNHPSLYGWYIADEPTPGRINSMTMQNVYNFIKGIDPNHKIVIVATIRGSSLHALDEGHTPYAAGDHDLYSVDWYPVMQQSARALVVSRFNQECYSFPTGWNSCAVASLMSAAYAQGTWSPDAVQLLYEDAKYGPNTLGGSMVVPCIQVCGGQPDGSAYSPPSVSDVAQQYIAAQRAGITGGGFIMFAWDYNTGVTPPFYGLKQRADLQAEIAYLISLNGGPYAKVAP